MNYRFVQNNPGGIHYSEFPVVTFIKAENAVDANEKAQTLGIYFNGTIHGIDCGCPNCGNRWSRVTESDAYSDIEMKQEIGKWESLGQSVGISEGSVIRKLKTQVEIDDNEMAQ